MKVMNRNPLSAENSLIGFAGGDEQRLCQYNLVNPTHQSRMVFKQLGRVWKTVKREEAIQTSQLILLPRSGIDPPAFRPERQESNNQ
jgi:hypothetical protein